MCLSSLLAHGWFGARASRAPALETLSSDQITRDCKMTSQWAAFEVALAFFFFWLCFNYVWILISKKVVLEIKLFWLNSKSFLFDILCSQELYLFHRLSPSLLEVGKAMTLGPCVVDWNLGFHEGVRSFYLLPSPHQTKG